MTRRDPSDMLPVAPALVMVVYCSFRDQATHMRVMGGVHLPHMQPRLDVWIGITFRTEPGGSQDMGEPGKACESESIPSILDLVSRTKSGRLEIKSPLDTIVT